MSGGRNILLTGPPGCGKSTCIERIIAQIKRPAVGFFTREIRERGKRVGFSIITLDGKTGTLAHRDFNSPFRVGRYGVDTESIERIALPAMEPAHANEIVVIDEIGKMEVLSALFRDRLIKVLDSENDVLGSVSLKGDRFIRQVKQRPDVTLVQVSEKNRESLVRLSERF